MNKWFRRGAGGGGQAVAQGPADLRCNPTQAWEKLSVRQHHQQLEVNTGQTPKPAGHVRFVCISDTHGKHASIPHIPQGDVLLHAGDITSTGHVASLQSFSDWLGALPHQHKVVIGGNHDISLQVDFYEQNYRRFHGDKQDPHAARRVLLESPHMTFLEDSEVELFGYKIFGSPWQPWFCDWAFNLERGDDCLRVWEKIPSHTDILITHGPPVGHGDLCTSKERAGCVDLLSQIQQRIKPLYHVFGHVHEGYGMSTDGNTTFINASTCTFHYRPTNAPIVFDLPIREPPSQ